MKRLKVETEIHEIELPVGLVKSDERLVLAVTESGDEYLNRNFERINCTISNGLIRPIIVKKEASE